MSQKENKYRVESTRRSSVEILVSGCTCQFAPSLYHKKVFLLPEGCKNHGRQFARATKFCTVGPNICQFSYGTCFKSPFWGLEHLHGFRSFGKLVSPCISNKQCLSRTQCEGMKVRSISPILLHCSLSSRLHLTLQISDRVHTFC